MASDVDKVFDWFDEDMSGEIDASTLRDLYEELRYPGIRLAQVIQNFGVACIGPIPSSRAQLGGEAV